MGRRWGSFLPSSTRHLKSDIRICSTHSEPSPHARLGQYGRTHPCPISYTPRLRSADHDHPPVIATGPGAKAGEVATDENQATGLERFQVLGQAQGVDVFDMQGILMTRQGTLKNPIIVPSFSKTRQIGCTGFPVDSHDTIWLSATIEREHTRCPECGNVFQLKMAEQAAVENVEPHAHAHAH